MVVWIRNNRHRFKLEVFEPPAISLNVPDRRFADAVEAAFNGNQLRVSNPMLGVANERILKSTPRPSSPNVKTI